MEKDVRCNTIYNGEERKQPNLSLSSSYFQNKSVTVLMVLYPQSYILKQRLEPT